VEGLVVPGVRDHDDPGSRLAPACQFVRHRNGKEPVFLSMDDEYRQLARGEGRLRIPYGRHQTRKVTGNADRNRCVTKSSEGLAENQAVGRNPMNRRRGHAAAELEAKDR